MGTIIRQAGAPIQDGETASGTEMEAELDTIFTEINGNLDDSNIKSGAAIDGSKLATNSVPGAQLAADGVTTAKMAAASVPKGGTSESVTNVILTTSATFVDVPGVSSVTVTPGSNDDVIICWLTGAIDTNGESVSSAWQFAFSVDGTDEAAVGTVINSGDTGILQLPFTFCYSQTAGTTSSIVLKPRYRLVSGVAGGAERWGDSYGSAVIFTTLVVPTK